ncbi:MAG: alpha/beta hydrolase [Patescibacteria group bacterium]|jgi:predicted alpha/beta hydrolase family esterase|nr:alpha/beta hydrolase [Patescibacteria group bacterium]
MIKRGETKKQKEQILYIHGGDTFKSRKDFLEYLKNKEVSLENPEIWSGDYLKESLKSDFEIIKPRMPLKENAKYGEWKIMFEKYLKLLNNNSVLIGYSLGGIFLAKYLSENIVNKKLKAVYLIGSPYNNDIPGEDLVGGFRLKSDLSLIYKNCSKTRFLFSSDDPVVPQSQVEKYRKKIKEADIYIIKKAAGHFRAEKLPELIKMIKEDCL